jgi:hypothetical protein
LRHNGLERRESGGGHQNGHQLGKDVRILPECWQNAASTR